MCTFYVSIEMKCSKVKGITFFWFLNIDAKTSNIYENIM